MSRLGKYARIVGLAGGLGALAWAMRDRMVSIAIPREPDRPVFRTPPTSSITDDLTRVSGIGPVFARRLAEHGIRSFQELANTSDQDLADYVDVAVSRVQGWSQQAKDLEA